MTVTNNKPQTDPKPQTDTERERLQAAIDHVPRRSIWSRLKTPWTGVYILLLLTWVKVGGIQDRVYKATSTYTTAPVLVQVGPKGTPILAQQDPNGSLNDANVKAFLGEIVPPLNRFDMRLPREAGGGIDKGVALPDTKLVVPTPVWIATQAIAYDPSASKVWLAAHMQSAPPDLAKGAKSALQGLQVGQPEGTGNTRTVTVRAVQWVHNPDGSPRSAMIWARKYTVRAIQRPRFVLDASPMEKEYNSVLGRGLQIVLPINDAQEVLP
jgi:hypothetical protein